MTLYKEITVILILCAEIPTHDAIGKYKTFLLSREKLLSLINALTPQAISSNLSG